jgi:cell division protein FtsW
MHVRISVKKKVRIAQHLHQPDWVITGVVLSLICFGVLMVFDASIVEAYHELGDQWYFIKNQSKSAIIGIIAAAVMYLFPLKKLEKISPAIMISSLLLLVVVLIPGIGIKVQGARRWLNIVGQNFQPSEYAKLAIVLYLSSWFSKDRPARSIAALLVVLIGLIMLEPDMGTTIVIIGIIAVMYFLSGVSFKKIIKLFAIGSVGFIILIAIAPYRLDRIKTFMNPLHDPLGVSYHARQVLISLGSGGLTGTGLGRSRQKFQYLPEASTDSIFAVVAEEFGFLGAALMISGFGTIAIRGLNNARMIKDKYISNIAAGISIWFGVQVLLNLMAMVGLVPLTGIPLPLISYGGSALIMMLIGIGLLLNASRYTDSSILQTSKFRVGRRK